MFFIVTGIQFWMTIYLIEILGNDPFHVVLIYSAVSVTAPLAGVLIGGTFADRYGGYKGKNVIKALKLCSAFGVVAFVFAFPIGFLYSIVYVSVLLWAFLFFGAAVIPVGTGIMVSYLNSPKGVPIYVFEFITVNFQFIRLFFLSDLNWNFNGSI